MVHLLYGCPDTDSASSSGEAVCTLQGVLHTMVDDAHSLWEVGVSQGNCGSNHENGGKLEKSESIKSLTVQPIKPR